MSDRIVKLGTTSIEPTALGFGGAIFFRLPSAARGLNAGPVYLLLALRAGVVVSILALAPIASRFIVVEGLRSEWRTISKSCT